MAQTGTMTFSARPDARFLRLRIFPRQEGLIPFNCGWLRLNNGSREPFDNTCSEVVLPLENATPTSTVQIEMEETFRVPHDPRELGMGLYRVEFLM